MALPSSKIYINTSNLQYGISEPLYGQLRLIDTAAHGEIRMRFKCAVYVCASPDWSIASAICATYSVKYTLKFTWWQGSMGRLVTHYCHFLQLTTPRVPKTAHGVDLYFTCNWACGYRIESLIINTYFFLFIRRTPVASALLRLIRAVNSLTL